MQEHVLTILKSPGLIKNSHSSTRKLLDDVSINIESLRTLNLPVDQWDAIIVPVVITKFDYITRKEWESTLNSELPTYKNLIEFLQKGNFVGIIEC